MPLLRVPPSDSDPDPPDYIVHLDLNLNTYKEYFMFIAIESQMISFDSSTLDKLEKNYLSS